MTDGNARRALRPTATFGDLLRKLDELNNEELRRLLAATIGIMATRQRKTVATFLHDLERGARAHEAGDYQRSDN